MMATSDKAEEQGLEGVRKQNVEKSNVNSQHTTNRHIAALAALNGKISVCRPF